MSARQMPLLGLPQCFRFYDFIYSNCIRKLEKKNQVHWLVAKTLDMSWNDEFLFRICFIVLLVILIKAKSQLLNYANFILKIIIIIQINVALRRFNVTFKRLQQP